MQTYRLTRTEQRDLEFTAELLVHKRSPAYMRVQDRPDKPNKKAHWFELAIYRTKGGKIVLQILYRFQGKFLREVPFDLVKLYDSIEDALSDADDFDATSCVQGFPPSEHWAEKQATLMQSLQDDYDLLVESVTTEIMKSTQAPEVIE